MKRRLTLVLMTSVLALAAAAPVAANDKLSCVGWFASTAAPVDRRDFGAGISFFAHEDRPFGRSTVAPFAHLPLEFCQP